MKWGFEITDSAQRDIDRLDPPIARRVEEKLDWFIDHFEQFVPLTLSAEYSGSFKLRVGDWRIIYEPNHNKQMVFILNVEHRNKAYKKRR